MGLVKKQKEQTQTQALGGGFEVKFPPLSPKDSSKSAESKTDKKD